MNDDRLVAFFKIERDRQTPTPKKNEATFPGVGGDAVDADKPEMNARASTIEVALIDIVPRPLRKLGVCAVVGVTDTSAFLPPG